jgi:aspartate 1-decarboxylase
MGEKVLLGIVAAFILAASMLSANALVINQFNAPDYAVSFNTSVIPATVTTTCTGVYANYTINITLGANLPADGKIMIDFIKNYFDVSNAVVANVQSSGAFGSYSWYVDTVEDDIWINRSAAATLPAGEWVNITILYVLNPTQMGTYTPRVVTTDSGDVLIEYNDSVNVTIVNGPVYEFKIWYWNATAGMIESTIPDDATQACCPTASCNPSTTPFYINVSAVDACGNLNASWAYSANLSYNAGSGWQFLKTLNFAGGWNNTTVCQPYTGDVQLKVENTTAGVSGTSNVFWVRPAGLGGFLFDPNPPKDPVYVTYPFDVTVKALDACGNFKYDYNGTATLTDPLGFLMGTGSLTLQFTNGVNTSSVWVDQAACPLLDLTPYNLTVGNASLTCSNTTSDNFTVTYILIDPDLSSATATPDVVPADNTSYSVIDVWLKDPTNTPLVGVTVRLKSDRGSTDYITPATATTDSNGHASFQVSSHTAGVATLYVEAWDGCQWVTLTTSTQVTFSSQVANPGTSLIEVVGQSGTPVYADNTSYYIVKVTARDNEGNPVENVNVILYANSSNVRIEPSNNMTDANGEATFKVYSTEWGWFAINATVNGQLIWSGPVTVYFAPWVNETYIVVLGQGCSGWPFVGLPHWTDGISELLVQVNVYDMSWKDIPGAEVNVTSNVTDDNLYCPDPYTNEYGYTLCYLSRDTDVNTTSLLNATARVSGQSWTGTGYTYVYWATNVTSPANSTVTATPSEVIIDSNYGYVYVTIRDSSGMPLPNVKVTLTTDRPDYDTIYGGEDDTLYMFYGVGPNVGTTVDDYTNCSGVAVFRVYSNKPGTSTFTAKVGNQVIGTAQITFAAPACGYYVNTWYAEDYLLNLEEKNTTTVHMQILYGGTPVPDQVVKLESLSNCGSNIVDIISPSTPVTNETGWITFTIRTDTAIRNYYAEGSACNPVDSGNLVKLVVKIGECYLYDYNNPLEVLAVVEQAPKEKPTLELSCGEAVTDYPWSVELRAEAPYYVAGDTNFVLTEFKFLLEGENGTYELWDYYGPSGPSGCNYTDYADIYYEDFEQSCGDWYVGSESYMSTWECGEPLQSNAQFIAWLDYQDKGWATGLGHNYNPAEDSYLYTKQIPINLSDYNPEGYISVSYTVSTVFESGDWYALEYSTDGVNWYTYTGPIPVSSLDPNATFIQFRWHVYTDGDTGTDEGIYIDWFSVYYYRSITDYTSCYGYTYFYPWWYDFPYDETTYNFTVKAVYCKSTPNGDYCMEAPLSDPVSITIDTQGPDISMDKTTFNASEDVNVYFNDFVGVDTTNDDFYVNTEGFTANYDYFWSLPLVDDWRYITWDNKYINVHFKNIDLSGDDYIFLWVGNISWTGGVNNVPVRSPSQAWWYGGLVVGNITYNYWEEFPEPWGWWGPWNDYFGSVHGDLWFKFPVSASEVCWLSYEGDGYIFYYDNYPPNYGFDVDLITYGTGVKVYLDGVDITDSVTITENGVTIPNAMADGSPLSYGTHELLVVATDKVGNANSFSTTFTVLQPTARFTIANLSVSPNTTYPGGVVEISAEVTNIGEACGNYTAGLYINGSLADTTTVYACPSETVSATFYYQFVDEGIYTVTIDNLSPLEVNVTSAIAPTGDVDGSGTVDFNDLVAVLNLILSGSYDPAADLDGSGTVDFNDLVAVLNIILGT